MWLMPAQIHAANLRLSENLNKLSPDALNFPCPVAIPFWGRHEQETVLLCTMLRWCLYAFPPCPEPCFGAPVFLPEAREDSFSVLLAAGLGARAHRKVSFALFLLYMNPRLHLLMKRWKVP